jgi:hypothetical protein
MFRPASPGKSRHRERGGISWVTLLLIVLVVGGGYLGWVWAPLYFEHYAVKQVVRDYMNQAIKDADDDGLRRNMVLKIRSLREVDALDARGGSARVPAVALDERRVRWERNRAAQPPTIHVAFEYERQVLYPLLDRAEVRVFDVDLTGDLTRPDWGPAR